MTIPDLKKDFFVSYTSRNRGWAEWIAFELEAAGYSTILQAWDFRPGSNFVLDMQQAAITAHRTMPILSPAYLAASFTHPEWAAAFARDPLGAEGSLVPVRVEECDPEGLLKPIVYIDLVGKDEAEAREALLHGIRQDRAKPITPLPFPGQTAPVASRPRFPGALPPVWRVPHLRNMIFIDREGVLEHLRVRLQATTTGAVVDVLHGLGGVGKTQVATEHAYRSIASVDLVWWIRADRAETLIEDVAALGSALGLPTPAGADQLALVQAVRHWLGTHARWLLIFDDAESPSAVGDYLPQGGAGQSVITSRNPHWRMVGHPTAVEVLPRDDSITFLTLRSNRQDDAAMDRLAAELGDLPLALAQGAAYMEETGVSADAYLERFAAHRRTLLKRGAGSPDYQGHGGDDLLGGIRCRPEIVPGGRGPDTAPSPRQAAVTPRRTSPRPGRADRSAGDLAERDASRG